MTKNTCIVIIAISLLVFTSGCVINNIENKQSNANNISLNLVDNSINNAINFLYVSQLEYGEFKTYACKDKEMANCYFDSSPFVTTFVLYSIKDIQNDKVESMTNK